MKNPDKDHFLFLKDLVHLEEKEEFEEIRNEYTSLSPSERELRGKALLNLDLEERHYSLAGHFLATFTRQNDAGAHGPAAKMPAGGRRPLPLFTLEIGDMVSLVAKPQVSDEFLVGTVYEKTADSLTVAFQQEVPDAKRYELHRSVNRVTFKRMAETLDAVSQTQNTRLAVFRDISLGLRKAASGRIEAASLKWFDAGLNRSQKEAVWKALSASELALVHGPPGTGKTRALVELVRQSIARKLSVFVTAPSNTACDNLLERLIANGVRALRLGHPARVSGHLREHTLDFKLALHPAAKAIPKAEAEMTRLRRRLERYRDRRPPARRRAGSPGKEEEESLRRELSLLRQEVHAVRKEVFARVMKENEVVVGTPTGVQDRSVRERRFDLLVMDEATQATEPMAWIPMTVAGRVVMAGDHFQLPPTVRSKEAESKGLGRTLFERYYDVLGPEFKALLDRQYRMNEKIMSFSSRMFYEGRLVADESVRTQILSQLPGVRDIPETHEALLYLDTAGKGFQEKLEAGSESRYNPEEADLVLSELRKLLDAGVNPSKIAVISPYSAQVRLLCSLFSSPGLEIDSVDGFQGREKELVLVSLVRSNLAGELGFLNDTRRMNVAMTRARRKLIVVGDGATLSSLPFYKAFIAYSQEVNGYKTAWETRGEIRGHIT